MPHKATRYHDISCGHRVVGHENKCRNLHGHNYRVHFVCQAELDTVGRVIDFGVIKERLCLWLEEHWDHKFLLWNQDPIMPYILDVRDFGLVNVPFNPTAENMAEYLVNVVAPLQLATTGVRCTKVIIEETRKCSASYEVRQ